MAGNALLRATMQVLTRIKHEITVNDPEHPIPWARRGRSKQSGHCTVAVRWENNVPIIKIRLLEIQARQGEGPTEKEMTFEVFGSSAFEVLETLRDGMERDVQLPDTKGKW